MLGVFQASSYLTNSLGEVKRPYQLLITNSLEGKQDSNPVHPATKPALISAGPSWNSVCVCVCTDQTFIQPRAPNPWLHIRNIRISNNTSMAEPHLGPTGLDFPRAVLTSASSQGSAGDVMARAEDHRQPQIADNTDTSSSNCGSLAAISGCTKVYLSSL